MQARIKAGSQETMCSPEWVKLNQLLSVCVKSLPGSGAELECDDVSLSSGERRCKRENCLFSAKRA